MTDMKTAYEKAMEKVEKLSKATPEELARMDAVPTGNRMAARYMKELQYDIEAELAKYKGTVVRKQVIEGVQEILLRYIQLPQTTTAKDTLEKVKRGIMSIKDNKRAVEQVFSQLDNLFNYYEQARQQAFGQIKQMFEQKIGQQMRAMGGLGPQPKIDVTTQPQFREEWAKVLADLNSQYDQALSEQKQRLAKMS
ncbi:MAG: hypothetical protein HYX87_01725 [Chloroflexi bacterium]|nr:hypothetical protein [Chloroflexota bacterium]